MLSFEPTFSLSFIKKIAEKGLSCARRSERAEAMVKQYIEQVKAAILDNLPRDGDAVARERTEQLNACLSTIRNIIDESDPNRNRDLCAEINSIISPAEETFDNLSGDCFEHYVRSQITKWRDRMLPLPKFEDEETQLLIPEKQHEALIETLYNKATAYQKDIVESLVSTYSNILDKRALG